MHSNLKCFTFLALVLWVVTAFSGCGGSYMPESQGTTQAKQPDNDPAAMTDPIVDPDSKRKSKR